VLPFSVSLRAGEPVYEQVVYAVRRAVVTGQLRAGDAFPSVRELSQALKINPNTAQRIVSVLVEERLLAVRPGIGTFVGAPPAGNAGARQDVLERQAERLVIDARHNGIRLEQLVTAIRRIWSRTIGKAG
jgi:DNA-binding transcriptional regulator YhcF (GntR family)